MLLQHILIISNLNLLSHQRVFHNIGESLLLPTPSRISVTKRDIKKVYIYTCTVNNLMINMNKYFVF